MHADFLMFDIYNDGYEANEERGLNKNRININNDISLALYHFTFCVIS